MTKKNARKKAKKADKKTGKMNGRLALAKDLVKQLEAGDEIKADSIVDEITSIRESSLFQEVGRMTRELHDAMLSFANDTRVSELTEDELPDAKDRLNHVIKMTQQAADQTLNAVEAFMPLCQEMSGQSRTLSLNWERFVGREMPLQDFRGLADELKKFLPMVEGNSKQVYEMSNDVLLAQNFQDLTGQIIRRVIRLLEEMQEKLVGLLRVAGERHVDESREKETQKTGTDNQDIGPHVLGRTSEDAVSGQDEVDDLLSSLGF